MSNSPYTFAHHEPPPPDEWRKQATCLGRPVNLFFPAEKDRPAVMQAKAICATCPVKNECRQEAINNHERGVWGATTDTERQPPRQRRKPPKPRTACGTPHGHVAHYRHGESSCRQCLDAHRDKRRQLRAERKAAG